MALFHGASSTMPVRVLCLHGWRTNPAFMEKQMKTLMAKLPDWDFSFLAGPISGMLAADDDVEQETLAPYFQWWEPIEGIPGQLAAVRYVAEHIRNSGGFDVLLGFSEGAACASLLVAAMTGTGKALPSELKAELADVPLPRLLVSVCGVPPEDSVTCCFPFARAPKAVKPIKAVPSVHVVGYLDDDKVGSLALAKEWFNVDEKQVLRHPHGHRFPLDCRPLATAMETAAEWQDRGNAPNASLGGC